MEEPKQNFTVEASNVSEYFLLLSDTSIHFGNKEYRNCFSCLDKIYRKLVSEYEFSKSEITTYNNLITPLWKSISSYERNKGDIPTYVIKQIVFGLGTFEAMLRKKLSEVGITGKKAKPKVPGWEFGF